MKEILQEEPRGIETGHSLSTETYSLRNAWASCAGESNTQLSPMMEPKLFHLVWRISCSLSV